VFATPRTWLAVLLAASCLGGCRSSPADVVVRVGNAGITRSSLEHWISVMAVGRKINSTDPRYRTLEQQALQFLVSSRRLIGEAARQGLGVSEREVKQRADAREAAAFSGGQAEFAAFLKASGQTLADVDLEARSELASEKLRRTIVSGIRAVTQAQAAGYYKQHLQEFLIPEVREVRISNRKTAAAALALKREVAAGTSFAARSQRETLQRSSGGVPGEGHPLTRAIYAARPNVLSGPVKERVDYYYVFEVKRALPATRRTFAEVRQAIIRRLTAQRRRRALANFASAIRARWAAKTSCRPGYVVPGCRQYEGPAVAEDQLEVKR
jgi:foldase protein PrsA